MAPANNRIVIPPSTGSPGGMGPFGLGVGGILFIATIEDVYNNSKIKMIFFLTK